MDQSEGRICPVTGLDLRSAWDDLLCWYGKRSCMSVLLLYTPTWYEVARHEGISGHSRTDQSEGRICPVAGLDLRSAWDDLLCWYGNISCMSALLSCGPTWYEVARQEGIAGHSRMDQSEGLICPVS